VFHAYVFTEMPYPFLPPASMMPSNRTDVPNSFYDPDAGHELYKKYLDIYAAADELGLDVMVNEHHTTATCTDAIATIPMAILARETKRARILTLGNPVANRPDPVRVAEEMAMIDVISGGRTDIGFVRGVPQEIVATNSTAVDSRPRFWEAVDLIMKAFTTHDGPFDWEGEYFHHRNVNLWPRPYQTPHPPIWSPTTSASSSPTLAERQMTVACLGVGSTAAAGIFGAYRQRSAELGIDPPLSEFAYSPLLFVGDTDEEGYREAEKVKLWFREGARVPPVHRPAGLPAAGGAGQDPVEQGAGAQAVPAAGVVASPDGRRRGQHPGGEAHEGRLRDGRQPRHGHPPAPGLLRRGGRLRQPAADGPVLDHVDGPDREEHGALRPRRASSLPRGGLSPHAQRRPRDPRRRRLMTDPPIAHLSEENR
jgi:alkanesulfonate monooxygenase SsuD/methylene tetrahydromethanopterin reductase-like flavin-dependent oxidoreductase (luciferase family)